MAMSTFDLGFGKDVDQTIYSYYLGGDDVENINKSPAFKQYIYANKCQALIGSNDKTSRRLFWKYMETLTVLPKHSNIVPWDTFMLTRCIRSWVRTFAKITREKEEQKHLRCKFEIDTQNFERIVELIYGYCQSLDDNKQPTEMRHVNKKLTQNNPINAAVNEVLTHCSDLPLNVVKTHIREIVMLLKDKYLYDKEFTISFIRTYERWWQTDIAKAFVSELEK